MDEQNQDQIQEVQETEAAPAEDTQAEAPAADAGSEVADAPAEEPADGNVHGNFSY